MFNAGSKVKINFAKMFNNRKMDSIYCLIKDGNLVGEILNIQVDSWNEKNNYARVFFPVASGGKQNSENNDFYVYLKFLIPVNSEPRGHKLTKMFRFDSLNEK